MPTTQMDRSSTPCSPGDRTAHGRLPAGPRRRWCSDRTITVTGYAVAAGIAEIGEKALAKVPPGLAAAVLDHARAMIEDAVNFFRYQGATIWLMLKGERPSMEIRRSVGKCVLSFVEHC